MGWIGDQALYARWSGLVGKAAGISVVTIICHSDMWAQVVAYGKKHRPDFAVPDGAVQQRDDGLAEVVVPGVQLSRLMYALHRVRVTAVSPDYAIASRAYLAMARVVNEVTDSPEGAAPSIVLDDRLLGGGA